MALPLVLPMAFPLVATPALALPRLATAWALFQGLLLEALPFLLLGVLIAAAARWLAPDGAWLRRLPSGPVLGPLGGAALGLALPACECGNVPVARRLLAGGAPMGTALGFLFAAPVLNPIVIASTAAAFPDKPWLLLARPLGAVVVAVGLALLLALLPEAELLQPELLEERRLRQPLAAVGLLERRGGLVGAAPLPPPAPVTTAVRRGEGFMGRSRRLPVTREGRKNSLRAGEPVSAASDAPGRPVYTGRSVRP